jgi:hypothetical protein
MTNFNTELESFLLWFSRLEEVPLQTRRDFFAHVLEVGGLDAKAQQFIDQTLDRLEKRDQKKMSVLQEKINLLDAALKIQEIPELSLKEKIVTGVTEWMNDRVEDFKSVFRAKESRAMKSAESAEEMENAAEIARLKAAL